MAAAPQFIGPEDSVAEREVFAAAEMAGAENSVFAAPLAQFVEIIPADELFLGETVAVTDDGALRRYVAKEVRKIGNKRLAPHIAIAFVKFICPRVGSVDAWFIEKGRDNGVSEVT